MSHASIYPEFFKTGIGKLHKYGAWNGDFLGLFSALEHFRRDITDRHDVKSILEATELYVLGLDLFETVSFFLVNPVSFDFEITQCAPETQAVFLQDLVRQEMRAGRFAWARRQTWNWAFPCNWHWRLSAEQKIKGSINGTRSLSKAR